MTESKLHKTVAKRIAEKYKSSYNPEKGADIQTKRLAIEVETPENISDGIKQLQGYRKSVYIAGINKKAIEIALEKTKSTTIGVMNSNGNILKRSKRSKS